MFGYDEEAIYQDADLEMMEYQEQANRRSALRRKGLCLHDGWMGLAKDGKIYYPEQATLKPGQVRCTDGCGQVFDSEADLLEARAAL